MKNYLLLLLATLTISNNFATDKAIDLPDDIATNSEGQNEAHLAIENLHFEQLEAIIINNSLLGRIKDDQGLTPVNYALKQGRQRLVHWLIDHGGVAAPTIKKKKKLTLAEYIELRSKGLQYSH